jgi:hypothetical protein
MRVNMFVAGNKIWVQEYSTNHMNGLRHCAAKTDDEGCTDSCFLGRMWNDAGAESGGIPTPVPDKLVGFAALSPRRAVFIDCECCSTEICIEVSLAGAADPAFC